MTDLRNEWWARYVENTELFEQDSIKLLPKAEIMKIRHILELSGSAGEHRILIIDKILREQDRQNPFIQRWFDGTYRFNEKVDFWEYIKKAKKYR